MLEERFVLVNNKIDLGMFFEIFVFKEKSIVKCEWVFKEYVYKKCILVFFYRDI